VANYILGVIAVIGCTLLHACVFATIGVSTKASSAARLKLLRSLLGWVTIREIQVL